uniref:BPTI/Kunitz inhibitor domain-containing protein n=1 Tax=Pseudonaja textilis TaxID=8673 RepID=A0A670ZNX0_PSETE
GAGPALRWACTRETVTLSSLTVSATQSQLPLSPSLPVRSDQCQLPRNQGSCSKELQHFYYDPEEKKCISFVYHGCEGNSNNFPTRELCEKEQA